MDILDGVGHGTLLGGRYRLEDRLQAEASSSYWRGTDQMLERPVGIRVVHGRFAADTLDAARRGAVVEDPRLLRVLDVGTTEAAGAPDERDEPGEQPKHLAYVVAELVDAPSLATVLHDDGPLDAEQVRTMVGEAAQALEHARLAGLHHRRMTPESLLVCRDGTVKVVGLAIDAAATGIEDDDDVSAARQDAVALVGLLYAGMTARWPLDGEVRGLEAAPTVAAQPTPPSDLVSGVPVDLDTLCVVTLGPLGEGPRTPGELAEHLAPWGFERAEQAERELVASRRSGRPAVRFPVRVESWEPRHRAEQHGEAPPAASDLLGPERQTGTDQSWPDLTPDHNPPDQNGPDANPGQIGTDDAHAAAAPRPAPVMQLQPDGELGPAGSADSGSGAGPSSAGGAGDPGDAEPPAPSFAQAIGLEEYADPPRRSNAAQKIVMAVVAAVLVIGLVLAVHSLSSIGGGTTAKPATTPSPTASAPISPQAEPAPPTEQAPPPQPPVIASVSTLDPQGGDGENDETAPLAIDDDPRSAWVSSIYKTADFGGLKEGLGLVVHLAQPATVSKVTLGINGTGGSFEIRTAPDVGLGGSAVVGTGTAGQPVEVALAQPLDTQYLIIWFTSLPSTSDGFRVELTQVQVQ